jgi:excisionase family DNA binding protein
LVKTLPRIVHQAGQPPLVELGEVSPPDDEDMLNAQEAAQFLNVSVHKVSRLVRLGLLPAYVWSADRRHRRFERQALENLRPEVADLGNDWEEPTPDNRQALEAVYQRLAALGVPPGPNGYDLPYLIDIIEQRGWAWSIEKESGPWRFDANEPPIYSAVIDREYRPGVGGLMARSHGWSPNVAVARSLDQMLQNEASGASRLVRR